MSNSVHVGPTTRIDRNDWIGLQRFKIITAAESKKESEKYIPHIKSEAAYLLQASINTLISIYRSSR